MKWMKRALVSMKRRPVQMGLMFLIVFVLGNVLFASIAVKQSSENVKTEMRSRIPTKIDIKREYSMDVSEITLSKMEMFVEDIQDDPDITKISANKLFHYASPSYYYDENGETIMNGAGSESFNIFSSIEDDLVDLKIKDGRNYAPEDLELDKPKIVVSEWDFYWVGEEYKYYQVGDTLKVPIWDYEVNEKYQSIKPYVADYMEFEVIGIYDGAEYNKKFDEKEGNYYAFAPVYDKWLQMIIDETNNRLDAHSKEDKRLFIEQYVVFSFYMPMNSYESIHLNVKGMDAVERLEEEIKENDHYANAGYKLETTSSDYRYIQAPLENLVALANVAMWASAILVVVLLGLVSTWFMKTRQHEIGILMALGERKGKIVGQFVAEILLVGLLASSFSMISGNMLGSAISNEFIRIQIDTENEIKYGQQNEDSMTQLDMLEAYKVEMTSEYVLAIYAMSTIILLISSGISAIVIIKMKPKDVLM